MNNFFKTYKYALIVGLQGFILSYLFDNMLILIIGIGISLLAFIFKRFRNALTKFEEAISKTVAKVINCILLSTVFLVFLLPIGLLKKVISPKKKVKALTLLDKTYTNKDLENPW